MHGMITTIFMANLSPNDRGTLLLLNFQVTMPIFGSLGVSWLNEPFRHLAYANVECGFNVSTVQL